jgi:hypothetical protein
VGINWFCSEEADGDDGDDDGGGVGVGGGGDAFACFSCVELSCRAWLIIVFSVDSTEMRWMCARGNGDGVHV